MIEEEEDEEEDEVVHSSRCSSSSSSSSSIFVFSCLQVSWKAKNVPENKLRLRLPVWVTDLQVSTAMTTIVATDDNIGSIFPPKTRTSLSSVQPTGRSVVTVVMLLLRPLGSDPTL